MEGGSLSLTWPQSVAPGYVRTLMATVRDSTAHRLSDADLLQAAGLPADLLKDAKRRLPHDVVSRIWQAALTLTGDRHLGLHVGERVRPGSFDALGHLLMSCETLREAAVQADRFSPLVGGGGRFFAQPEAADIRLLYLPFDPDWPCRRHRVEAVLAATLTFTRWLCSRSLSPHAVRFRHAAPENLGEYRRVFGCPVSFDAEDDSMLLGAAELALPVQQASPALKEVLTHFAEAELSRLGDGDPLRQALGDRIRALLGGETGLPPIELVAKALNLTPRTLQRRLAERGTSFQAEVSAVRCEMAKDLLRDPTRSMAAIAARLGFADVANFHRAFKGWTGATPGQWRRQP